MKHRINQTTIELIQGDITKQTTDCIVNAANSHLHHGGGVARAIATAAGKELQEASSNAPQVPTGEVFTTPAGNLRAKYVIHAVGPVWKGGENQEAELLRRVIVNCLKETERLNASSVSLPAISTGIYGYPLDQAATIMLDSTINFLQQHNTSIERIIFVLFTDRDFQVFSKIFKQLVSTLLKST